MKNYRNKITLEKKTIEEVAENGLCSGCGTCIGLCPNEAIKLTLNTKKGIYNPQLNEKKCNKCGICYNVCHAHSINFKQLNLDIFGKEPDDVLIGNYINCYIGYSTDYNIRYNSSSGGLVTRLLIFALENGIIDGALVTRMKKDNPLEPEPFIARTREEIIEASKSKYCPVPANVALKEILKKDGKYAVVGLPCHIQGIRKAERINKKLKEKIVLHLGIICSHTNSFLGTEFLLNYLGLKTRDIRGIEYRGGGWPGSLLLELKDNTARCMPYTPSLFESMHLTRLFTPERCMLCYDGLCWLADISFGDAWGIELTDKIGTSLCISRNEIGENILRQSLSADVLKLKKIDKSAIIGTQGLLSNSKIRYVKANERLFKIFHKSFPKYDAKIFSRNGQFNPKSSDYIKFIFIHIFRQMCQKKQFWRFNASALEILRRLFLK